MSKLPTPTMSAAIGYGPAPSSDRRRGRKRPERATVTLSAPIVERYTRIAEAQGRGRYEVMNEALEAQLAHLEPTS